jgi:hypothetical protein
VLPTCGTSLHCPAATNATVNLFDPTVQIVGLSELTDLIPGLFVTMRAVKVPPTREVLGKLLIVGASGVALPTANG